MSEHKWVKVNQPDYLEYPQKIVNCEDGEHWYYTDDTSQEPRHIKRDPLILEDNEDGTFTHWQYTVWGAIGYNARLTPGATALPLSTKKDRQLAERVERMLESARRSQIALAAGMLLASGKGVSALLERQSN